VLRAAELQYDCAAVHPFADGNGRTARLMMNYDLLRHGYPLAVLEVTRRGEYLAALDHANAGRLEPFATFVAESVERSIARAIG
jgi:Fic family protein